MEKNINLIVETDENNLRLDVFVNKREELISRTRIKNLILKEKLKSGENLDLTFVFKDDEDNKIIKEFKFIVK